MSTGKAILLFILGIILALLTLPIALIISAGLGYAFAIIAIVLGAYLISKWGERKLPLVLGIVLLIITVPILLGTAFIHMGLWMLGKAIEEATKTKSITAHLGETIKAGDWEITVLGVKEAMYIKKDDSYYKAKEGYKAVLVALRIKNLGKETKTASEIWDFILVTNANKSYEGAYTFNLDYIPSWSITEEVKTKAVAFKELDTSSSLAPDTIIEGDLLFQILEDEEPIKLHFKVGVIGGYEVAIKLKE